MLLGDQILEFLLDLLELLIKLSHIQVVLGIVWLLEHLLRHFGNGCLDCDEQIVSSTTPFSELILSESRVEDTFACKRRILVRHFLAFFLKSQLFFLLLSEFFATLLALVFAALSWLLLGGVTVGVFVAAAVAGVALLGRAIAIGCHFIAIKHCSK